MEPTEPLLGALRSMSHYSTNSDTVQLIGAGPAKMSTASGGGDVERLGESQAQSSVEDSLRKRVAGGSPTSGGSASDEFFRVEVRRDDRRGGRAVSACCRHCWKSVCFALFLSTLIDRIS